LEQIIAQVVWKCRERSLAVMLQESYAHIGMLIERSYRYATSDTFTLVISDDEDALK
jgi:hypothetical protein